MITKAQVQAEKVEYKIAFEHVPGLSKWLHFTYDIGRRRLEYRLRVMNREGEDVNFFDDLDEAIAAFNEAA